MKNSLRHVFSRLLRDQGGLAYLEFAAAAPVFLVMLLGTLEVSSYVTLNQKIEKAAISVSDVVAQSQTISTTQLNIIVQAASEIARPYRFSDNAYVIVSSVNRTGNANPIVNWQYRGGGTWTRTSRIGTAGQQATLPSGFTLNDGENIIVAEVFYRYVPLYSAEIMGEQQIYKFSIFKPRLGSLTSLGS